MDQTVCSLGIVFQPVKIKQIVFIREKTGLPVVSTLDEMEGNTGYNDSGSSWHNALDNPGNQRMQQKNVVCPLLNY
jgi:hypothetical protein